MPTITKITPTPEPESAWAQETEALQKCLELLSELDKNAQTRAVKYLKARIDHFIATDVRE